MSDEIILKGRLSAEGTDLRVGPGEHRVGRSTDCDFVLSTPSISRSHAILRNAGGRLTVEDLGSHNGTRVNDVRIAAPTVLNAGDVVAFADMSFVHGESASSQAKLTMLGTTGDTGLALSWDDIRSRRPDDDKRGVLFQVLADAGDLLVTPRPPEDLFEPILDIVESAMGPERILLLCRPEGGETPAIQASRLPAGARSEEVVLSRTVVSRVMDERASFLMHDVAGDIDLANQQSIVSQGIRSAMAAPLFDNRDVIGLLYADTTDMNVRYTEAELTAFSLLANVIAVALTHARYDAIEAEKRRLETELSAARSIMATLLPEELPAVEGYDVRAHCEACFEVGGDLYDVSRLEDGRVSVVLGDVAGKGLGAALMVSGLIPLLRALLESERDLTAAVTALNRQLMRTTDRLQYATLFVGVLDPESGRLEYCNAGHVPPVLRRADGRTEPIASTGTPVALIEDGVWSSAALDMGPGDLLAVYSDGISETWNEAEEDYTEERFARLVAERGDDGSVALRDAVLADLDAFRGDAEVGDDVTMLLLGRASR